MFGKLAGKDQATANKFDGMMKANLERHELVKYRLRKRQTSLAKISRDLGIQPGSVTAVSQGYRRSKRVEQALAEALDMTPEDLFPEHYPKGGNQ